MHWDDLQYFLAAWEARTLTAAAASLGVAQATMSRRMATLEDSVGQVLFERTRQGLVPTPAARALYPHARQMEAAAREATAALQGVVGEPEGEVRLTCPPGAAADLAAELVPVLRDKAPKVHLTLLADTRLRDLIRHEADLALRSYPATDADLVCQRVRHVDLAVFASPALAASLPDTPDPTTLPWLQWSEELAHIPLAHFVASFLGDRPPAMASNSFLVLREAALAGLGCMVMPRFQGRRAGLVPLKVPMARLPPAPVYIIFPASLRRVPRVRVVVEAIHAVLGELVPEALP